MHVLLLYINIVLLLMMPRHSSYLHRVVVAIKMKILSRNSLESLFQPFSTRRSAYDDSYIHHKYSLLDISDVILSTVNDPEIYCSLIEKHLYRHTIKHIIEPYGNSTLHMLLCVSGGSDSMAMMHLFHSIRDLFQPPICLMVVNFNHKMRAESDEEVTCAWQHIYYVSC